MNNNISVAPGQRIAKVIARSGYCSRRKAEELIVEGRVKVNGQVVLSPAILITDQAIKIDDKLLEAPEKPKLWLFHKPKGYITTHSDPQGRKTIFELLPDKGRRLISVGRLDINTEGLLLLTNDGEIANYIALPRNRWTRNYRVRAYGKIDVEKLDRLKKGSKIDGVVYGPIKIEVERERSFNSWLKISLTEGKNREIKKVLEYCGLKVNRLIRVSFGPFHLGKMLAGELKEVPETAIKESLGAKFLEQGVKK